MNPIKRVLGHLYFIYALIMFFITLMPVLIPVLIALCTKEPTRARIIFPTFRVWMEVYLKLIGCSVKRTGAENFIKGENYVVVLNHNSFADIPISAPWVPGPNKTLAKIEITKVPFFGLAYRAGSILVDRKSEASRKRSLSEMQETLKLGLHLTLYPEGTRNKTDKPLLPFYDGAFINAIKAQKAIIPGIMTGTKALLPDKPKVWAWPQKITLDFLPAIPTEGLTNDDRKALKEKVFNIMEHYITKKKSS